MKDKLTKCNTIQESHDLFSSLSNFELNSFVNALKKVKEYIDLTMRDDFLLIQADSILLNRGYDYWNVP